MEIGQYGYQKSELLQVSEQIYELKSKKQQLELQLSSEEFHQKYIPKRENMIKARIRANLPLIIGLFLVFVFCVVLWVEFFMDYSTNRQDGFYGVLLLGSGLFIILSIKYLYKLGKEESEMAIRFIYSRNPDKAMRLAEKYDIKTFQDDRIRTKAKLDNLKEQILVYDNEIHNLELRQQEIIDEKIKQEETLKKQNVTKEADSSETENEKMAAKSGGVSLSLKEEDDFITDIRELDEYYTKEQNYILMIMKDLDFKLTTIEKDIANIDVEMQMAKKRISIFAVAFICAAFVQAFIPGFVGYIYGLTCLIVSLYAVFAIERACRGPVIRYLVEKESELVAEYCFRNDVVPLKQKKKELQLLMKQQEEALEDIKRKKRAL